MRTLDGVDAVASPQIGGGRQQHGHVDGAREDHRQAYVPARDAQQASSRLALRGSSVSVPGQAGVQIHRVWHHRGAQHRRCQQQALGALKMRDEPGGGFGQRRRLHHDTGQETDGDDGQ
ncbi:Uncharacterised protein [Mycobacteroides abscessus subsp. massiliense]|nr:Uncharacterised protein [Mycobacteroides abscessus subsp. massiliense]